MNKLPEHTSGTARVGRRRAARRPRRSSISDGATRKRPAPPRRRGAPRAGLRRAPLRAVRGLPELRRPWPALWSLRGRARPGGRGRGRSRHEDRDRRALASRSRTRARSSCCPTLTTRLPSGPRAGGGRPATSRSPASGGRPTSRRRRRRRRRRLPQLPLEPVRGRRPRRRVRGRGRYARETAAAVVTTSPMATSSSTGGAGELPRHARREGGRGRDVLDVEVLRDGRLAGRVRRRERRDRRAGQPAQRSLPRRDLPPVPEACIAALAGPQTRSPSGATPTSGGATACGRARASGSARARSTCGSSSRRRHRRAPARRAPRRGRAR